MASLVKTMFLNVIDTTVAAEESTNRTPNKEIEAILF